MATFRLFRLRGVTTCIRCASGLTRPKGLKGHRPGRPQAEVLEGEQSFWQEVQQVQQQHVQAAREAQARRRLPRQVVAEAETDVTSELADVSAAVEGAPIQEIDLQPRLRGIHAPGIPSGAIVLAERLLSAKSPGEVLALGAKAVQALQENQDPEERTRRLGQMALALQILARQAAGPRKAAILKDQRLKGMVQALQDHAQHLEVWILCSGSAALGRLGALSLHAAHATAAAAEELLRRSQEKLGHFSKAQAALLLASLALVPERLSSAVGSELRNSLVSMLELQSQDLPPEACAQLAPALVKLRSQSETLAQGLAKRLSACDLTELSPEDVAKAAQSLVALRQAPNKLMEATEQVLRHQIHLCTPRAIVHFAGSLSEGRGDVDVFKDFLMPAARSFISDFNCRDLCTIAESFAKAGCAEADFLADLAEMLQRKVGDMGAHEVSVAFQVFAPISYAVPALLPAVTQRAMEVASELSPKQLTHTLQGLSRSQLDAEPLLPALKRRAQQLAHVLFGTHAVTVLVALSDAQQLDHQILKTLSETILRHLDRLSAQDYIAVLSTLSRNPELRSALPVSCVEELLQALRSRGYGPWRLELEAVVHLLEALHGLRLEDEVLLELLLDRLPAAMQLSDLSLTLLLRFLEALADLPKRSRAQVAAHLHRRRKLQNALKESLYKQVTSKNLDLEAQVVIAKAIARLGYEEPLTQEFLERLTYSPQLPTLSLDTACDLCFTLAQQSWQIEWNRRFAWKVLHALYGVEIPQALQDEPLALAVKVNPVEPGSLLRLAWALAVLDEALPLPLLEQLADLPLPRDWGGYGLKQLQEVALHHQLQAKLNKESVPCKVKEWMELVLEVPREDQYVPQQPRRAERNRKQISAARYSYETWLTVTLSQLHLPHQAQQVVGCHRVPITFKRQLHLIDVLSLEDLTVPAGRITGSAELRRRQLMQLGWAMHSIKLSELYEAARTGTLRLVVSKLVSSLDETAASGGFAEPMLRKKVPQVRPLNRPMRIQSQADDEFLDSDGEDFSSVPCGKDPRLVLRQRAHHVLQAAKKSGSSM